MNVGIHSQVNWKDYRKSTTQVDGSEMGLYSTAARITSPSPRITLIEDGTKVLSRPAALVYCFIAVEHRPRR